MSSPVQTHTDVFISYSHHDKRYLTELLVHLTPLVRDKEVAVWADTKLQAGDEWREEIRQALASATVAIVLVSAQFRASKFIAEEELPPLLAAAKTRGMLIIPVIVGFCPYDDSELAYVQAVNSPSDYLSKLRPHKRDVVWVDVMQRIERALTTHVRAIQVVAESQPITGFQRPTTNGDETAGRVAAPAWGGVGGEQILSYARELEEQGRYGELLDMAIDMNLRGLYFLASPIAGHAVNGPTSPYDAWFERAFALAQLNSQGDAITAFKRAYGLIDARLRDGMPDWMPTLKLPSGSRGVAFAGAGSGVHYHGMGLVPDAIIALRVAGTSFSIMGSLSERGTIRHSTFHKTATYLFEMGGNTRWVALAVVLGDGPTESELLEPVAGIDRVDVDDIIRWGTLLNGNMEYVEALAMLDKAIQRDPSNFNAWFEKTYALTALNRKEAYGAFARAFNESNPDYRRLGYSDTVFEAGVRRSMFAGVGLGAWAHNLSTVPTAVYCVSESGATALYHPRADDANIADTEVVRARGFGDERWVGLAISDFFDSEDE
jgi:tetratricopeptide (TPR) repeat protein